MLKFENIANGRYYYLLVEKDLLGDLILTIYYGGEGHHFIRKVFVGSSVGLDREVARISKRRIARGYELT
jgi:hypothetical protein